MHTDVCQNSLSAKCVQQNDEWAGQVLAGLECARDLHAADAVYHQPCNVNFRRK